MVQMVPVEIDGRVAVGITVELPKTRLVIITTGKGYLMCGALDVGLLRTRLADRGILAARAVGVRTIEELLAAPVDDLTQAAESAGIQRGMPGREALVRMF